MRIEHYYNLKSEIIRLGYEGDVTWAENVKECPDAETFFREFAFVVCNSGMKAQIARKIFDRIMLAKAEGRSASEVFGHKGKAAAIDYVFEKQDELFAKYLRSADKLLFLASLPWIGEITKFHLAKNFGFDCCKPDRHLVRIAAKYDTTPEILCSLIADMTGERIGVVDLVIWRAANLGLV